MSLERETTPASGPSHAHRRSPTRVFTWLVCCVAAVLGFSLVFANTWVGQASRALTPVNVDPLVSAVPSATTGATTSPEPTASTGGKAINILLMGSDQRNGANSKIGGYVGGMRNDTTIIMHISADRSRIDMVSIPRDAQVKIPDCKLFDGKVVKGWTGDFNVAFANGGKEGHPAEAAACVINTVQKMSGIKIDHWAVVDFKGFEKMVNALGGVPMCIPEHIVSKKARLNLKAGPQILNGTQALGLARMRTAEVGDVSGSDLQRIARQHELLRQMSRVVLSKNMLTDAGQLTQFFKALASSLTMDPALASPKYLLGLAFSLRNIEPANIKFNTIPWRLTSDYLNVIINKNASTMWAQMRADKRLTSVGSDTAGNAWDKVIDKSPTRVTASPDATVANNPLLAGCTA